MTRFVFSVQDRDGSENKNPFLEIKYILFFQKEIKYTEVGFCQLKCLQFLKVCCWILLPDPLIVHRSRSLVVKAENSQLRGFGTPSSHPFGGYFSGTIHGTKTCGK